METTAEKGLLDILDPIAQELRQLDDDISDLNARVKEMKSHREELSDQLVTKLQEVGIDTSVGLPSGGVLKIETKPYVSVQNVDAFVVWADENQVQVPAMQFNASTLSAWFAEQLRDSKPVPPDDIVKPFWKTRVKINAK